MYCRHLLALLIAGAMASAAWADKRPLLLSCHGVPKTDAAVVATLCDALAAELNKRDPDRVVRHGAPSDTLPKRAWNVVLEVTRTENYHWEGHLTWEKNRAEEFRQAGSGATRPDLRDGCTARPGGLLTLHPQSVEGEQAGVSGVP